LEHAGVILRKLEGRRNTLTGQKVKEEDRSRIALQLNRVYIQLVNIYLGLERQTEASQLIALAEGRLEQNLDDVNTFKLLNELGNALRKHDNLAMAVQLYKKALLSIKIRFKNEYLQMRDTAKIIINIASTEYMRDENVESLRYYRHALSVLKNCSDFPAAQINEVRHLEAGSSTESVLRPE